MKSVTQSYHCPKFKTVTKISCFLVKFSNNFGSQTEYIPSTYKERLSHRKFQGDLWTYRLKDIIILLHAHYVSSIWVLCKLTKKEILNHWKYDFNHWACCVLFNRWYQARLDLDKTIKAKKIIIKLVSQLVVGQSTVVFEAREESMKKYQEAVRNRMMNFDEVTFQQIPVSENEKVDALAKLPSSSMEDLDQTIHLEQPYL